MIINNKIDIGDKFWTVDWYKPYLPNKKELLERLKEYKLDSIKICKIMGKIELLYIINGEEDEEEVEYSFKESSVFITKNDAIKHIDDLYEKSMESWYKIK